MMTGLGADGEVTAQKSWPLVREKARTCELIKAINYEAA